MARRWGGLEGQIWKLWAYCARYGRQPLSELQVMTLSELGRFTSEILELIESERQLSRFED